MKKNFAYNVHNIVTVVSEVVLPELEPFRVMVDIEKPTIDVRIGLPRAQKSPEENGHYMRYREIFGHLGFEVGIEMGEPTVKIVAAPMLRFSPHVLYTNVVEPLLRWTFVKRGYALVHGATIAFGNSAYMITARTDTGKTTTLLKILAYQRRDCDQAAFLSDDMTVVSPDGTGDDLSKTADHQLSHPAGRKYGYADLQGKNIPAIPEPHPLPLRPAFCLPDQ